jgi:uncharacterized membrane protein/YHS domain-containing protein
MMVLQAVAFAETDPRPVGNLTCPVMVGEPVDSTIWLEHEGRRVYFCCNRCVRQFRRDPLSYMANLAASEDTHATESSVVEGTIQHDHAATVQDGTRSDGDMHDHSQHDHQMSRLATWLGKLHPAMAHFPVALLIAATIAEAIRKLMGLMWLRDAARFCIWAGAAGAAIAVPLGWLNAGWNVSGDDTLMALHRWLGTAVLAWSAILVVLTETLRIRPGLGWQRVYMAALVVGALMVAFVGHLGGLMVFGTEYYQW